MRQEQQRQAWEATARAQFKETAAALESDPKVFSQLEEMIAARIGRRVRHVRSEAAVTARSARRGYANRRSYTKHWFEVSEAGAERLMPRLDAEGLLAVFMKTAQHLRLSEPLELILSGQEGKGFRAPYFFGSFTISDLKIGAWEAITINSVPFRKYSLEDQRRIVQAIAAANTVRADFTVPVLAKWMDIKPPHWFESKYRFMDSKARVQWKALYTETLDVMRHHDALVQRLWSIDETLLTHNDLSDGLNTSVPPAGDILLFDWELSSLSFPGADLAFLSRVESGDHLVSCYVAMMSQYGFKLDADSVRFSLDVVEGYRSLRFGWRNRDAILVERGLTLLTRHLSRTVRRQGY